MSGDVTLIDGGNDAAGRLVRTASTLFSRSGFEPAALVGGLAVTIRLATVHRATNDVDVVSDGDGPRDLALNYLGDGDVARSGRIEIDGVNVDVMPTEPLPSAAADLPEEGLDRLFVLGHRWALESAGRAAVDVVDPSGTTVVESTSIVVATTPALIACKFHALARRRDQRADKRESDALDLVRLIGDLVRSGETADHFATAPFDLVALVTHQVARWFIEGNLRTARLVNLGAAGDLQRTEPADVSTLGHLFIDTLRSP